MCATTLCLIIVVVYFQVPTSFRSPMKDSYCESVASCVWQGRLGWGVWKGDWVGGRCAWTARGWGRWLKVCSSDRLKKDSSVRLGAVNPRNSRGASRQRQSEQLEVRIEGRG